MSFAHTATATSTATPDLHHERFGKISSSPSLSAANLTFGNNLQRIDKNPLGINTKSLSSSTTGQDVFDSFITSNLCKPPSVSQDLSQSQPLVQRRIPSATCLRYRKRKKWWITASQPNQQEHQEEESAHTTSSDWFFDLFPENYHPYSRDEIPYWLSYRPEVIDHHILMMYASSTLRRSSPFEIFSDVPSPSSITDDQKTLLNSSTSSSSTQIVLDLGCGPSATWCIGLLRENTKVRVIGLDICPISFDPSHLESSVSSRFRKVHHNFLSGPLPFSDNTFDYVHASFISSGVPETHWTTFMEEVMRVLKPG